ncbi:Phosphonate ABC transporter phosphate-binding periplasmic component (TC 3.A.1.9.1) [hydrothermal vent metagenome]|uniref:Phosphonate ABC transporter phosphate-binding periplasmic component (TC 3.A.1.9.1) n=1 Tax=hydrothermal vent metagenome TaxID=652676 RepID=A0A3B1BEI3_9ZZZZ
MRKTLTIFLACLLASFSFASDDDYDHEEVRALVEAGVILPLEQILERMWEEHPGRILEVELEREYGRYVYEIELLDEKGRVWELEYDAANGEFLEKEREE